MLADPAISILGPEPVHRKHAINGCAYQQDVITSCNGWQYSVFYSSLSESKPEPLYLHLARRELPDGAWDTIVFDDYGQTTDDGHNTAQIGICEGDGTIHLSYDHHCDVLRYRHSCPGVARNPHQYSWTATLFTPTLDYLPGIPSIHKHFSYVTYPRLRGLDTHCLFMSLRDGKAGDGSDHLYLYRASKGFWEFIGTPLTGVQSNPYVHGWDLGQGNTPVLHVTWVYRGFVWYEGWDDLTDTKHKQQAGPNGAENNHNICYASSKDFGITWENGDGAVIADLKKGETITNDAPGIVAFEMPKGSGLMNQEAQAVDYDGGVHVLNRDTLDGKHLWKHYYRSPQGTWTSRAVRPIDGPSRGRLAIAKNGDLILILPATTSPTMRILRASKSGGYATYNEVWTGHGISGEPLVDVARLDRDGVMSVFAKKNVDGTDGKRNVVVMDFRL